MRNTMPGGTSVRDTNRNGLRPTLSSAVIGTDGVTLTLTFNKKIVGNNGFTIDATGGAATIAYTGGIADELVFTISRTIIDTETVTLDYAAGDVRGLHGGDALATITDAAVTNNSEQMEEPSDVTPPEVVSATVAANGSTFTIVFDEIVTGNTGFTIDPSGGAATLNYSSGSGTASLVYTTSRTILADETLVLDYTAGDVEDAASNALATIVDLAVTNDSTQTDPGEPPVGAIVIDNDWLTTNGPAPYLLDEAGEYYWLEVGVEADGTVFAISANDITLDLNQRTITYDNITPIAITNASFEEGTAGAATGWDFSGAPDCARFAGAFLANQVFHGDYSLRIAVPCANQYITNTTTVTLPANTTFSLSAMFTRQFAVAYPAKLYVDLIGQGGEPTIRVFKNTGNTRGMQFVETVFTTGEAGAEYEVRAGIEDATGSPVTAAFIDDIKIQQTRVYGVAVSPTSSVASQFPGITTYGQADNATIKNGFIVQGADGATWGHNIFAHRGHGMTVDNITSTVHGANGSNVGVTTGTGCTITDNTFTSNITAITSRDQFHGSMIGNGCAGTISGNTLLNGPHTGIRTLSTAQSFIFGNTIRMKNRYTNGFAIQAKGDGTEVHDNIIDQGDEGYSGRGIFMDSTAVTPVKIYDNTITVQALANNQEYGGAVTGGAYGIQLDHGDNCEIYGNTVTANALEGDAHCMRLNNHSAGNNIHDNTFTALRITSGLRASCVKISAMETVDGNTFADNTFTSNSLWVQAKQVDGFAFTRTTLNIAGDDTGAKWFEIDTGSYVESQAAKNVQFIDNTYGDAAARTAFETSSFIRFTSATQSDQYSSYFASWTTTFLCQTAGLAPIEGATVVVVDEAATEVVNGTTNASGELVGLVHQFRSQGVVPSTFQTIEYNPHTATGTSGALTDDAEFTADQVQTITLTLI